MCMKPGCVKAKLGASKKSSPSRSSSGVGAKKSSYGKPSARVTYGRKK